MEATFQDTQSSSLVPCPVHPVSGTREAPSLLDVSPDPGCYTLCIDLGTVCNCPCSLPPPPLPAPETTLLAAPAHCDSGMVSDRSDAKDDPIQDKCCVVRSWLPYPVHQFGCGT